MKPEDIKQLAQKERERQQQLQDKKTNSTPASKPFVFKSPDSCSIYSRSIQANFKQP